MDCGHSVCARCSHAWFDQIDNTFLVQHPGVNPRSPVVLPQLLFDFASRSQAELWEVSILCHHLVHPPHAKCPWYTCPACKRELHSAPTKNLGLKAAVQAWATSRGIPPPPAGVGSDHDGTNYNLSMAPSTPIPQPSQTVLTLTSRLLPCRMYCTSTGTERSRCYMLK